MDKDQMTPGMRVYCTHTGCNCTYVGPENGSDYWALVIRDDGVTGCGPNGEYAVTYPSITPLSNLGSTSAAATPPARPWAKAPPATPWHHPFQIGDRVYIEDECEGQILGFDFEHKFICVARDDDQDGSGGEYMSLHDGKVHTCWNCSLEEVTLLTSGTRVPGEGLPVPPSEHKMGLDPETIDWSKFKKIRDML